MGEMFQNSEFTGDISNWNVSTNTDISNMFEDSQLDGYSYKWYFDNENFDY
jgi:hypothetical protein